MNLKTSTANAATDKITTDAGTTAYILVYTGTAPVKVSNAYVSPTGTLLASLPMSNPIASATVNGVLTLSAITTQTGAATGTPGYFRFSTQSTDTDGTHIVGQGTCAIGSGEINWSSQISSGGNVSIATGMTITNPAAA